VPPSAQTSDQNTYQTCFCQSAYLATFKQSPIDICAGVCTAAELQQIQTWYTGLCTPGGPVVTPNQDGAAQPTSTAAAAAGAATSTASASSQNSSKTSKNSNPSWISTHYRWVIMIIILILAGIGFTYFGLWLKRRHSAKHDLPHRDSTLAVEEAAASMRSRHPEMGSMAQLPAWERASVAMSSREMVAATPPPGAVRPTAPYHSSSGSGSWKGKERTQLANVSEPHGGVGSESAGAQRSPLGMGSKRLGKKGSKRERR
jgi:hypothetical protein